MSTLVWLPFSPDELDLDPEIRARLRFEVVPGLGAHHDSVGEVEVWVPPYGFPDVDLSLFPRMASLRLVQTLTAGVDHIAPSVPDGVTLCNGRGIHEASTAELAVALTLASLRGLPDFVRAQDRGEWLLGWQRSLADRRVLILGYGAIGAAIEQRLEPFECEVVRVASTARDGVHAISELPDLLGSVDVVTVIVPLNSATRGMVDAGFLARMRPGALLVNVGRGPVVDTDALLAALTERRITAALDVTDPEPLPAGHPLWSAPGLLISPHTGGATSAMWPRARRVVAAQLTRYIAGEPLVGVIPH